MVGQRGATCLSQAPGNSVGCTCCVLPRGVRVRSQRRSHIRGPLSVGTGQWSRNWRLWVFAGVSWCGLIAGTSSTVILPHDFFAWIASHVLRDEASFRAFAAFWGFAWFAIVKGWHATEFAILCAFAIMILDRIAMSRPRRNVALALAFSLLFAVSDEYHQTFVPGRGGTWTDVVIDGLGASVAGLIALRWRERPNDRSSGPSVR